MIINKKDKLINIFGIGGFCIILISMFFPMVNPYNSAQNLPINPSNNLYISIIYITNIISLYAINKNKNILKIISNVVSIINAILLSIILFYIKRQYNLELELGYYAIIIGVVFLFISTVISFKEDDKNGKTDEVNSLSKNLNQDKKESLLLLGSFIMGVKKIKTYSPCVIIINEDAKLLNIIIKNGDDDNFEFGINFEDLTNIKLDDRVQMSTQMNSSKDEERFKVEFTFLLGLATTNPLLQYIALMKDDKPNEKVKFTAYSQVKIFYNFDGTERQFIMESSNNPNKFISKINEIIINNKK